MRHRVVVTGIGCVTPLGNNVEQMWDSLKRCANGVGPITHFPAEDFPTRFAAEVKDFSIADYVDDPERFVHSSPNILYAIGAATQAMTDSGLADGDFQPPRFGVYLGAGEGGQDFERYMSVIARSRADDNGEEDAGETVDVEKFVRFGLQTMEPQCELEQEPNRPAGHLAGLFNAQGPNMNCLTACAASSQAIGEATELIRRGDVDVMLSGGAHSMIHPFGVTGFSLLTALSTHNEDPAAASRPFDLNRDGFVLGEGAGMLVLEELEHARARGAHIHGEVLGYGSTADAYRITDIHPEGRGATACIKMALKDAGINRDDLQYINAHGTSTKVNDKVETMAVRNTLEADADSTPVSSIKSMMGHLIAAAGSVEAITCLLAIRDNVLPPTRNYETPDPDCDLDYVPNEAREAPLHRALSNSFGFGGQNISLVLSEFNG
ncbi:MAG TPA: beta-ketoacyl-[acyl-carrier-protein] synthase II [Planctomycetaceae bacterium]|nr:beta-ketoacyl-[acyl-carrier-protein] synthase II [Planctomycetaceae bacterium]HCK52716.1 beta-ketoacyl-[acyl-carrier-protein] synthase II [Planctomycetaceae bacterium]|tara:strand:+ start:592 stop:1899 length:1308 start_codon:yes stop_codon:yes gene_type:complete